MRRRLLALLKIREQPDPPPGSGPELLRFRASRRFLGYGALTFAGKQIGALLGLLFYLDFTGFIDIPFFDFEASNHVPERVTAWFQGLEDSYFPFPTLLFFLEVAAIAGFTFQLVAGFLLFELAWELRWYMVGDESLRIREGLWRQREQTVTIANIQNMTIRQGPLQKLFRIEDLEVHTAGGGDQAEEEGEGEDAIHVCRFRGLEDAAALRDRIRDRLTLYRGAGLGEAEPLPAGRGQRREPPRREAVEVAGELLREVRRLRRALAGGDAAGL